MPKVIIGNSVVEAPDGYIPQPVHGGGVDQATIQRLSARIKALENDYTSSALPPTGTPTEGTKHWDSNLNRLWIYDGAAWKLQSGYLPHVSATRNTVQSIPHAFTTVLSYTGTDEYDTDAMHDTGTNPSRVIAPLTGMYAVGYQVYWPASVVATAVQAWVAKNGTSLDRWAQIYADIAATTQDLSMNGSAILPLAANDYLEVYVYHTNAGTVARNVFHATLRQNLALDYLHPT